MSVKLIEQTPQKTIIKIKIQRPTPSKPESSKLLLQIKTYHHNPSPQLVEIVSYFASIHRYDDRKTFKEEWNKWIENPSIQPIIHEECERLKYNQYEGDPMDKIFKSVRYYYRKKTPTQIDASGNQIQSEKKPRKKYESLDDVLLEQMDEHIQKQMNTYISEISNREIIKNTTVCLLSPAESYSNYLEQYAKEMRDMDEEQQLKIKKTYKNRFFKKKTILIQTI
jgi:hypothetical protein